MSLHNPQLANHAWNSRGLLSSGTPQASQPSLHGRDLGPRCLRKHQGDETNMGSDQLFLTFHKEPKSVSKNHYAEVLQSGLWWMMQVGQHSLDKTWRNLLPTYYRKLS